MPGATPVWGIRYPLQGEPVSPTDFANLAADIDAAFDAADAARDEATRRPEVIGDLGTAVAGTTSGTVVPIPYGGVVRDDDGWWSAGSPTIFTVPAGVYNVNVFSYAGSGHTTVTGEALAVQVAGVTVLRRTFFGTTFVTNRQVAGTFFVAAPSAVRVVATWFGTGTATSCRVQTRMRQIKAT